jgi:hypothetical protein
LSEGGTIRHSIYVDAEFTDDERREKLLFVYSPRPSTLGVDRVRR